MWNFNFSLNIIVVLLLASANAELSSDYETWMDEASVAVNVSETSPNLNESIALAQRIKINKKMEDLYLGEVQCATQLKSLIAEDIGLSRITFEAIELLPSTVQNLTIVGNNIKKINSGVFSNLTIINLNMSSNKIEIIVPSAFDYMKNLTSIILDHNEIAFYNITFIECSKLKLISLKFNFIKQLSEGILQHLNHNVLSIFLSYNNIREIHKAALAIKQFHEVRLDHNELINALLLIKLVKAEVVDLSENHITCLPKEFMENGLSKIKLLNLTGNPLECNCMQDLQRKVRKNIEFQKMSPLVQNINIILPKNKTC